MWANELARPFGHLYKGKDRHRLPLIICGTQSRLSPHNAIDSCIALNTSKRRIKRDDASAGKQVTHAGRGIERSRVGTAKRQIRPGAATFAHDLYHAIPSPRVGRKQNLVQAVRELHPKYGFHRAPRTFEYVRRD